MTNAEKKGHPFSPLEKSYLHIEEFKLGEKGELTRTFYRIPDRIEPIETKRSYTKKARTKGKTTRMSISEYLYMLFLTNEIQGTIGEAKSRDSLLRTLRKEHPKITNKTYDQYCSKFSNYISAYNAGSLYSKQPSPPLYAWYWTETSLIRHNRYKDQLLSFAFCRRLLEGVNFLDPRFFSPQELEATRRRHENEEDLHVYVPSVVEIERIEKTIKKPLYNSIHFPSGYGLGYDPI